MAETNQKLLTVRIDEGFLQQLRVATVARETTIAHIVRSALAEWLKDNPLPKSRTASASRTGSKEPEKAKKRGKK